MAAHARDILNFKYCKDTNGGSRERAEEIIRAVTNFLTIYTGVSVSVLVLLPRPTLHDSLKVEALR